MLRNQGLSSGLGVVEILIMCAVLAIGVIAVTTFVVDQAKVSKNIGASQECLAIANSLHEEIQAKALRNILMPPYVPVTLSDRWSVGVPIAQGDYNPLEDGLPIFSGDREVKVAPKFYINSVTYLEGLMEKNPNFCEGGDDYSTTSTLSHESKYDIKLQVYLKSSSDSKNYSCRDIKRKVRSRPLREDGLSSQEVLDQFGFELIGESDLYYEYLLTVKEKSGDGVCEAKGVVRYQMDKVVPPKPTIENLVSDSGRVTFEVANAGGVGFEQGSTFICQLTNQETAQKSYWSACNQIRFSGSDILGINSWVGNKRFQVDLPSVPDGSYNLQVRAVDSAGNHADSDILSFSTASVCELSRFEKVRESIEPLNKGDTAFVGSFDFGWEVDSPGGITEAKLILENGSGAKVYESDSFLLSDNSKTISLSGPVNENLRAVLVDASDQTKRCEGGSAGVSVAFRCLYRVTSVNWGPITDAAAPGMPNRVSVAGGTVNFDWVSGPPGSIRLLLSHFVGFEASSEVVSVASGSVSFGIFGAYDKSRGPCCFYRLSYGSTFPLSICEHEGGPLPSGFQFNL